MMQSPYSEEFLAARRQDLERMRAQVRTDLERLAMYEEDSGTWSARANDYDKDVPEDFADDATEATDLIERSAHVEDLAKELDNIEAAISRLDNGEYGWDERAGEFIAEDRLAAYPAAQRLVDDAD